MTDLVAIKEQQQEAWGAGDFSMFATTIVIVSELLCETADLRAGERVLDVATGSGNTAIAAARRGCDVIGVDFVPDLLERGRERAAAERLHVRFEYGDAEELPFGDDSFDVVLSTFGVMFAPNHERAAAELLRVCRPGGRIGMANFPPDSLAAGFARVSARYSLPPRGVKAPVLWGAEAHLRELFGDAIQSLQITRRNVLLKYRSASDWLEFFTRYFGPIASVYQQLSPGKRERYGNDLMELVVDANVSADETIVAPVAYSEVIATKNAGADRRAP